MIQEHNYLKGYLEFSPSMAAKIYPNFNFKPIGGNKTIENLESSRYEIKNIPRRAFSYVLHKSGDVTVKTSSGDLTFKYQPITKEKQELPNDL